MPVVAALRQQNEQHNSPAQEAFAITPSDTDELVYVTRFIYVGVTGDIKLAMMNDCNGAGTILLKAAQAGSVIPIRARKVLATGTTATDLIGLI